jgi:hypothetical protein
MDSKSLPIDSLDQSHVFIRGSREAPGHHFNAEKCAPGLDRIKQLAAVFDRGVEKFLAEISRVFSVPDVGIIGTGNVDTIASTEHFGQGELFGDIGHVTATFLRVRIEHVLPRSDLGNHHILTREFLDQPGNTVRFGEGKIARSIGRTVSKIPVRFGEHRRIARVHENRPPEPHGLRSSAGVTGQHSGGGDSGHG